MNQSIITTYTIKSFSNSSLVGVTSGETWKSVWSLGVLMDLTWNQVICLFTHGTTLYVISNVQSIKQMNSAIRK